MTVGVSFEDPGLTSRIRRGVDRVEALLARSVDSPEPFVAEAAAHLLNAGGKRFRPLLTLLCAEFGQPQGDAAVEAAVVMELTHLATLYHDDVMDEAPVRRGAPSANARWDNSIAILVGDYLFAEASQIVAGLGTEAVRIQAETFSRLVRGQIRETLGPGEGEDPLQHYLDVVADKTGSLIAACALLGSKMAGASDEVQRTLLEFGERIGVAFQLADDIIDIASESGDSGKTPGTDLREGVPTLPTLLVLASPDDADAELRDRLSGPIEDDALVERTLAELRAHPLMAEARAYVHAEADTSRALLEKLPAGPARDALSELCDTVVTRVG
ncbi:geranylgeranyl pyrophosphate synthase [Aeromicrobium sp. PE09-221]|uniref:polyprenyl synthetase family protein n=1 Tax=Aeromicrobium sp. PE09-221 TaxID=1898043 RepID=UPI000B3E5D3F|nr:polyprenyl synthetase family protein [Aeromicrobium sp. PE09-221]OUZ10621.1 geranylgeranyl pyrophosphate synthase [Aeromicrobium sp. PE09-221]